MTQHDSSSTDLDPRFTFDFTAIDPDGDQRLRLSSYWDVEPLCRGPQPPPDWVVTDRGAIDTELGILKTGKEGDVFLLERAGLDGTAVMAAKRYRGEEHRDFHRSTAYAEGRRVRNTRDSRAMAKKSSFGRAVAAGQWAGAEWDSLKRLWLLGVPVPYPVQINGTEILMELVTGPDGDPAPRLARERPGPALLASYFEQVRDAMFLLAENGIVHGDLSPYNVLAAGDRLVVIDLPQVIDLVANPAGPDFLMRDCHNMCAWFVARGLEVDEDALFADLLAAAW
ncbi:MAG: serine/threonine protein kinase [Nocardioidaceae bacterium]|nr:serine/threonine protein kinase [Nocardioidaceae bacterium]